jgi:hypothetical protein
MDLLFLLVIQGVIVGFFCSYIAKEKNRDSTSWFWLGFWFSIIAIFALIAVPKVESRNSSNSLKSPTTNAPEQSFEKSAFSGERNISLPAYQLFLTRRFAIEKNATLDKYVIGDDVFSTLEDSLSEADSRFGRIIDEEKKRVDRAASEFRAREKVEVERRLAAYDGNRAILIYGGSTVAFVIAFVIYNLVR